MALVLVVFAALLTTPSVGSKFAIGPAGAAFGDSATPPGYVLAKLSDLATAEFQTSYNAFGLNTMSLPTEMPANFCPFIAVREGALSTGTPLDPTPWVVAPFGSNQQPQTAASPPLASPVWFGILNATNFNYYAFVGPINATFDASLATVTSANLPPGTMCNYALGHYAVFIEAAFVVGGFGEQFPNPPAAHDVMASLQDVKSNHFVSSYNAAGLTDLGEAVPDACCVFRLAQQKYLTIGGSSYISPFTPQGQDQCGGGGDSSSSNDNGPRTLTNPIWFGTGPWGSHPNENIGVLNFTAVEQLNGLTRVPPSCSAAKNSWAIYKRHPGSLPPPDNGNCYSVEVQGSYDLPSSGICLAVQYRYTIRLNETYNVPLTGLNECGGSYSAFGIQLLPYNSTTLVGRTTGATNCDCAGGNVTLWGYVPLQSGSSMSQLCYLTVDEFNFCDVLISINRGPFKCPPVVEV